MTADVTVALNSWWVLPVMPAATVLPLSVPLSHAPGLFPGRVVKGPSSLTSRLYMPSVTSVSLYTLSKLTVAHRLFSQISMNWRGRPLTSHEVIIETITATTTRTGLTVHAALETDNYAKGIKISDKEMKTLEQHQIRRDQFHGEWNYTLLPHPEDDTPTQT